MKRAILMASAIFYGGISVTADAVAGMPPAVFAGKSGEGLARTVASRCRPSVLWQPEEVNVTLPDPFGRTDVEADRGTMPSTHRLDNAVSADWWSYLNAYADTVGRDLLNTIALTPETMRLRGDLPPGYVETATFDNGVWRVGTTTLHDILTDLYEPPAEYRGALARTIFYMATVYHTSLWTPRGYMIFTSAPYPGLTAYARELLMEWHRDCPPTEREAELNRLSERLQGNVNPFVEIPELAEYLWGYKAGEAFETPDEPVPLHGRYHSDDPWIYLTSPSVPADARWSIDGTPCEARRVSPASLGKGDHHLSYTAPSGEQGHLKITVTD